MMTSARWPTGLVTLGLCLLSFTSAADSLLNGLSVHKELNQEQFIGAVYTNQLTNDAATLLDSSPLRMELRVVADRLSSRRLNSQWIEGMAINNPHSDLAAEAENMVQFADLIKRSLRHGDVLAIRGDDNATTVSLNGVQLGRIPSAKLFKMVLRTWVGPIPLSSDFRTGLLTNGKIDGNLQAQFDGLKPAPGRASAVAQWADEDKAEREAKAELASEAPPAAADTKPEVPAIAAPVAIAIAKPQLTAAAPPPAASKPAAAKPAPAPAAPAKAAVAKTAKPQRADDDEREDRSAPALTAESLLSRQVYQSQLLRWTYGYISYPRSAERRSQEGSIRLSVTIDRSGKVLNVSTLEESEFEALNKAAIKAVEKASPFPAIPAAIAGNQFQFSLPIIFRLTD
ncbi:TonB family protein [Pseudomaricurvus sp. HS19]|uniref:TonB family protein n=1 Tax=Pseudomaricurvus sp. HS19 TaxID=2692626 RepID=UPI00136FF08A|nr:TonB family protein [Pseudomaricurvus sp. HS19]MYM64665.1 TonB family protein [Pseudomaricurvus sp. HS19]